MSAPPTPRLYFSFFMFTVDLRPDNPTAVEEFVRHGRALRDMGYEGFDLPIFPTATADRRREVESYARLRDAADKAGLDKLKFTTNVAATSAFDPSSPYDKIRASALDYLKSRVAITKALRGEIMAGPIVMPYGGFPKTSDNKPIWSDALQDWLTPRYIAARPVIQEVADYAADQKVKVAIEPVDHWETPAPNLIGEVLQLVDGLSPTIGVCIDSAHVILGSDGPAVFTRQARDAVAKNRLHYVHLSAPDRGAVYDSWIPWQTFLDPIRTDYDGPYLIEVFNAIPAFLDSLRLTRRKFAIPGVDPPAGRPDAYEVASRAIEVRRRF